LFVNVTEHGRLVRFWLEWGWIGDVGNLTYSKHEGVGDFFSKWGGSRFGGVYWVVCDVRGMSGIVGWPNLNTDSFLVAHRDLEFGVSDKRIKGVIPPDEKPRVIDKFEG
jgi:hypothetical protein